jgi:hypothetical protein
MKAVGSDRTSCGRRTTYPTGGATDMRLHRVSAYVRIGEGMVFKGGADQEEKGYCS